MTSSLLRNVTLLRNITYVRCLLEKGTNSKYEFKDFVFRTYDSYLTFCNYGVNNNIKRHFVVPLSRQCLNKIELLLLTSVISIYCQKSMIRLNLVEFSKFRFVP